MKKLLPVIFVQLFITVSYSADRHILIFKPAKNLEYKIQFYPMPDEFGYSLGEKITSSMSEYNIVKLDIRENDKNTYKLKFNLKMLNKRSCCNPLTYPGYVYTMDSNVENIIKPTGEFIENRHDYISLGCIFGFNLVKFNHNKSRKDKPVIIPFYFPEKEIGIGESWMCKFEFEDKEKTYALFINYTLKSITNNIAYIDGYNLDGLHVTSTFDITKGCWIDYRMYWEKDAKEYLWKSYELIK